MSFRFNAGHCLLTYSRCPLSRETIRDNLIAVCGQHIKRMVVGQEHHQDGTLHIHVAIKFTKKMNIRRANYFDCEGYHPNLKSYGTYAGAENYLYKEDSTPLEHGAPAEEATERLRDVCASFNDRLDWLEYCHTHRVQSWIGNEVWSIVHPQRRNTITEWDGLGTIVSELSAITIGEGNTLLVGRSGCGKSTWAKRECPKPALWVTHLDDLKNFERGFHKSIIFDDVSFHHLPATSQIHLVDWNDARSIHVRYGIAQIPPRTTKIFTCNSYPFTTEGEEGAAIRRRVRTYRLGRVGEINLE